MKPGRILLFFVAMLTFWIGLHNNDNAYNMNTVNRMFSENGVNITLVDWEVSGAWSQNELHTQSMMIMIISLVMWATLIIENNRIMRGKNIRKRGRLLFAFVFIAIETELWCH